MEQEPILNAHNKEEYPPMHTEGMNTSPRLQILVLMFGLLVLCGCGHRETTDIAFQTVLSVVLLRLNSKATVFQMKCRCRQNQSGRVIPKISIASLQIQKSPTSRLTDTTRNGHWFTLKGGRRL